MSIETISAIDITPAQRRAMRAQIVYFLRCKGFVKIGFTTDPARRLLNCRVGNPFPILLAAQVLGDEDLEARLHGTFAKLRHRDEWFRDEGDLARLVDVLSTMTPSDGAGWVKGWLSRGSR